MQILRPECVQNLGGAQVVRGDLVGIQPDPHCIFTPALKLDVTHALKTCQFVLHVKGQVIRKVERVSRPVRRKQVNREKNTGRRFSDLHAKALHIGREARQRVLHTVLREHLRDVEVCSDPESHGDGEIAISGGLAAHIEHVFDAVYLLFERRRDRARHRIRGRTRQRGGDLHRRRHDLRILRHRQNSESAKAEKRYENAENNCKSRTIDEEMAQSHWRQSASWLVDEYRIVPFFGLTLLPGAA